MCFPGSGSPGGHPVPCPALPCQLSGAAVPVGAVGLWAAACAPTASRSQPRTVPDPSWSLPTHPSSPERGPWAVSAPPCLAGARSSWGSKSRAPRLPQACPPGQQHRRSPPPFPKSPLPPALLSNSQGECAGISRAAGRMRGVSAGTCCAQLLLRGTEPLPAPVPRCLLQPGALQALAVPSEVWGPSGPSAGSIQAVCPSSLVAGSCRICSGVSHEVLEL